MNKAGFAAVVFVLAGVWLVADAAQTAERVTAERDSLRARTEELEGGIRQYILAAALLAQRNQVLEGQLSWCLNTPMTGGQ